MLHHRNSCCWKGSGYFFLQGTNRNKESQEDGGDSCRIIRCCYFVGCVHFEILWQMSNRWCNYMDTCGHAGHIGCSFNMHRCMQFSYGKEGNKLQPHLKFYQSEFSRFFSSLSTFGSQREFWGIRLKLKRRLQCFYWQLEPFHFSQWLCFLLPDFLRMARLKQVLEKWTF